MHDINIEIESVNVMSGVMSFTGEPSTQVKFKYNGKPTMVYLDFETDCKETIKDYIYKNLKETSNKYNSFEEHYKAITNRYGKA